MSPDFYLPRFESALRRLIAGICIVAHLAATTGFPLPQPKVVTGGSVRFPCEKHRCGCSSAEQCWRSCCCMTTAEKLAWAERNGVTPPEHVLAAAAQESEQAQVSACCAHRRDAEALPACCGAAPRSCCSSRSDTQATEEETAEDHDQLPGTKAFVWVQGIQAQHCQGLATIWVVAGAVLPPSAPLEAPVDHAPPVWFQPAGFCRWQSLSLSPDVPPPRCA